MGWYSLWWIRRDSGHIYESTSWAERWAGAGGPLRRPTVGCRIKTKATTPYSNRRTQVQRENYHPWGGGRAASTRGARRWKEAAQGWVWPSEPVSQLCTWRVLLMNFHPHPGYRSLSYLDHLSLIAATKVKVWKSALNSSKAEHEKDVFKTEEWVEVNPFNEAPKELVTRI